MATDIERLLIRIEASQRAYERQLKAINKASKHTTDKMERDFFKANKRISRSTGIMGRRVGRTLSVLATALSARTITRYADAWTSAGNKIKAASQVSGIQARSLSKLNDIATKTRSGLEETVDLYSRILRAAGPLGKTEQEVADATEIVAKAFKAGGASAQEQAAGILQLGQALGSGFLQGDELRSIRENSPLIAQAIADEFKTTIGGLKALGASGELVSNRVLTAILKGRTKIDAAFQVTNKTITEGFTLAKNAMIELVGAFNEGSAASVSIGNGLASVAEYLKTSTVAAKRFGSQIKEAFTIFGEVAGTINGKIKTALGPDILDAAKHSFVGLMDLIRDVLSLLFGVGAALAATMINSVDAVANGGIALANAAVTSVEAILNSIIGGVQNVVKEMNNIITAANALNPFKDIPTLTVPLKVQLEKFKGTDTSNNMTIRQAFEAGQKEAETQINGIFRRVSRAGEIPSGGFDPRGDQISPPTKGAPVSPIITPKPIGKGAQKKAKELVDFFANIDAQKQSLQDQIALISLSEAATVRLTTKQRLLAKAKKDGIALDDRSAESGRTVREEIDLQAEAMARLSEQYRSGKKSQERFMQGVDGVSDAFAGAIVAGESLRSNLASVFQGIARDILASGIRSAILGQLGSSSGGLFGKIFGGVGLGGGGGTGSFGLPKPFANGAAFSGGQVTAFATGGIVNSPTLFPMANGTGLMGEAGPEGILPLARLSGGKLGVHTSGGGQTSVHISLDPGLEAQILDKAQAQSVQITNESIDLFSRHVMPGRMNEIAKNPMVTG